MKFKYSLILLLTFKSIYAHENIAHSTPIYPNITEPSIKRVVIISTISVTGGVEALCQLCHELRQLNINAKMHFGPILKEYKNNAWYIQKQSKDATPAIYKNKYAMSYVDEDVILDNSTLIIIPEIWAMKTNIFMNAHVCIYWLSISHFLDLNIGQNAINLDALKNLPCIHLSDAPWIQKQLESWGIKSHLIEAPIAQKYLEPSCQKTKISNQIVYNPARGQDLTKLFLSLYPDHEYIPLQNLDELGVLQTLDAAKIYVDFGHFPGKDRIPREALVRDCIIFIHNEGCATDITSFPIDIFFKFSKEDIKNGVLNDKITYALQHYDDVYSKQEFMRQQIHNEPQKFKQQIATLFSTLVLP